MPAVASGRGARQIVVDVDEPRARHMRVRILGRAPLRLHKVVADVADDEVGSSERRA